MKTVKNNLLFYGIKLIIAFIIVCILLCCSFGFTTKAAYKSINDFYISINGSCWINHFQKNNNNDYSDILLTSLESNTPIYCRLYSNNSPISNGIILSETNEFYRIYYLQNIGMGNYVDVYFNTGGYYASFSGTFVP